MRSTCLSLLCGLALCAVMVKSQNPFQSGNYYRMGSQYPSYPSYPSFPSYPSYPSYGSRFMGYRNDDSFPDYNRPDNSWDSSDNNYYGGNNFGGYYRYD